ncbi:MAG: ABC transporter ATP-binding protein [Clostridia bacterium]|nr:ABC transporter ATP-binding protein [Clostridia bacterium]
MEKILEVVDLEKKYDNFKLDKISFDVLKGYIMGYIGPNGAGKTTTIKAVLDIIPYDGGHIKLFGQKPAGANQKVKERIGFVLGETAFYEFLSAKDMAQIISKFYTMWDWQIFNRTMKDFDLNPKQKIESYSKGMKVKYMIACAISHDAELFILDEPTSGLDPVFRSELMEVFQALIADGERSILFSTHITSDLESIADYITFINKGKLVFSNEKDIVLDSYSVIKGRKDQRHKILETQKTQGIIDSNMGFTALINQRDWFAQQFGNDLLIERATLEDIMIHTVRGKRI